MYHVALESSSRHLVYTIFSTLLDRLDSTITCSPRERTDVNHEILGQVVSRLAIGDTSIPYEGKRMKVSLRDGT